MKPLWNGLSVAAIALLAACGTSTAPATQAASARLPLQLPTKDFSVGSFDRARGGIESLRSPQVAGLRKAIKVMYQARFSFTHQLTPEFLRGVDVMLIGVGFSADAEIKPLSSPEQKALVDFVQHGREVLLFADNDLHFQEASSSMLQPFGVTSGGILYGYQAATWVDSRRNPLANGPAGSAAELTTDDPGMLSNYTPAIDLADFAGSTPSAAAYYPAGGLGARSGAAVFFSNSSLLLDGIRTHDDTTAILNALALSLAPN